MSETQPAPPERHEKPFSLNIRANLIAGVLTAIPLLVVWFVFDLLFDLLSQAGRPFIRGLTSWLETIDPSIARFMSDETIFSVIAAIVALIILYFVGLLATFVVGQQLIAWFEEMIQRIPFVQTIYGSAKQLVSALQTKPTSAQRVVLVNFPHPEMKAIGLVTKTFIDAATGSELAAVYVPTTPNPTSGYLEIVPVEKLIPTDLTMEQAMTMILSGGAVSPDRISFGQPESGNNGRAS
jgi:uncharacterized membrane protein